MYDLLSRLRSTRNLWANECWMDPQLHTTFGYPKFIPHNSCTFNPIGKCSIPSFGFKRIHVCCTFDRDIAKHIYRASEGQEKGGERHHIVCFQGAAKMCAADRGDSIITSFSGINIWLEQHGYIQGKERCESYTLRSFPLHASKRRLHCTHIHFNHNTLYTHVFATNTIYACSQRNYDLPC